VNTDAKESGVVNEVLSFRSWRTRLQVIGSSELLKWLGLTVLFASIPLFFIKHATLNDPDIWWHMRTGEWIIQNHRIPHVDPFSATTLGRPWVDYCWLFDVGAYWLVNHFDLVGIIWFQTVMRLAVTAALFSLVRSLMAGFWKPVALTGLGMVAMLWTLPPRPGAISVLFFVLELHVLVTALRKADTRWLWILPGLFMVWANIHIEFVAGLFVLAVLTVEPILDRWLRMSREPRTALDVFHPQLWYVSIASFLAVLVNPYGPRLLDNAFQLARDAKIYDVIIEFSAMHFRTFNDWAVLSLLMLACFALGRTRPFRPAWGVVLAWSAWMGFRSLREVWLVAILSVVIISGASGEEDPAPEKKQHTSMSVRLAVASAVAVILLAGTSVWAVSSGRLLGQVAQTFPVGAVHYIQLHHLRGPLLNELSWGGFLIYAVPEVPPSMDGRTNVHKQEEILSALPLWNGEAGWQNNPEVKRANLIISNHWWPLALLLRSDPRFRIVYEDQTAVLFEAVHTENAGNQANAQPQ
jgi:hypothetical protein